LIDNIITTAKSYKIVGLQHKNDESADIEGSIATWNRRLQYKR